jgi:Mrp family chromosome partitioning ATPase
LITALSERFDYLIIDASSVGEVADAFALAPFIDLCLFIVRYDFTEKENIHLVNDIIRHNKLPNLFMILNDTKQENGKARGQ